MRANKLIVFIINITRDVIATVTIFCAGIEDAGVYL